jgi:hypothetical protein
VNYGVSQRSKAEISVRLLRRLFGNTSSRQITDLDADDVAETQTALVGELPNLMDRK